MPAHPGVGHEVSMSSSASIVQHILVPTDFSAPATAALEFAVELARPLQARLTLLHVTNTARLKETLSGLDALGYLAKSMHAPPGAKADASLDLTEFERLTRRELEAAVRPSWRDGLEIQTEWVEGYPSMEIVAYAVQHQVDLIVMGSHGRSPIAQVMLGSVSENVIRKAECPVLTLRHPARAADRQ
jgi:nucleotide-binding universal stress UspA family protein